MTASPAQIAYATKLRDTCASTAQFPITEATIFGLRRPEWAILGYRSMAEWLRIPGDERRARMAAVDVEADAQQRATELRARQAKLGAADINSMTGPEVSGFISAAKAAL